MILLTVFVFSFLRIWDTIEFLLFFWTEMFQIYYLPQTEDTDNARFLIFTIYNLYKVRKLEWKISNFLNGKFRYLTSGILSINQENENQLSFAVLNTETVKLLKIHPSRIEYWRVWLSCSNQSVLAIQLAVHSIGN